VVDAKGKAKQVYITPGSQMRRRLWCRAALLPSFAAKSAEELGELYRAERGPAKTVPAVDDAWLMGDDAMPDDAGASVH
jgi:hypothetical protein